MINVFQPSLGDEELQAVRRVFESNWVGRGRLTGQFEEDFARHLGVERALVRSVACCTEGLFQAVELLGIASGDEVVLPAVSFVGAGNAVAASGATPIFCDVDSRSLNATGESIEAALTPRTKAVIILHYGGVPCELDEISSLLANRGIPLIEDSACSVASRYKGVACGTFGEFGIWSFDAMKILVTGDGGMIYCRSPELAEGVEQSLYMGLMTESGLSSGAQKRWWEFEISSFGRRAIMNDISSAIGLEQLKKLPSFIDRRKQVHEQYTEWLSGLDWLTLPDPIPPYAESSYYFYWVQCRSDLRDELAIFLKERGVYTTFRYYPLHLVRLYESNASLPSAEEAARTTLCLPIHQGISEVDVEVVVQAIHDFGKRV